MGIGFPQKVQNPVRKLVSRQSSTTILALIARQLRHVCRNPAAPRLAQQLMWREPAPSHQNPQRSGTPKRDQ